MNKMDKTGGMLVLTRKAGEAVYIGEHITVHVIEVSGGRVQLGLTAPRDVKILRDNAVETKPKTEVK